ncbi:MAG: NTP transferase domain-containing protein [Oscillospiraceae bacterium]|nr:NTP transferase domain-containing protein [Oscillospiraceae bacterium]
MQPVKVIVLAAGQGKRIRTEGVDLPKVLRRANGKPLLAYVLEALDFAKADDTIIVVGYQKERVIEEFSGYRYAVQSEQKGTGHAALCGAELLTDYTGAVLICCGDMPLVSRETYRELLNRHFADGNDCTMLTGSSEVPLPYGRVLRDENGEFLRIVENGDCTAEQLNIRELNAGVYIFSLPRLIPALHALRTNNNQGELYLTDAPTIIAERGGKVGTCNMELGNQIVGVNNVEQLELVERILQQRAR